MRVVLSGVLLLIGGAFVMNRVLAPLYGRYTAADCRAAYSKARTHHDSVAVDLHPALATDGGRMRHLCGEVRARPVASVAALTGHATR
jgi:hypothetical protein